MGSSAGLLVLFAAFALVAPNLSPVEEKECGDTKCPPHHYCNKFHHTCEKCDAICDPNHHNNDVKRCEEDCQDYLHDVRYERKDAGMRGLEHEFRTLKILLAITLTISSLALLVAVSLALYLIMGKRRRRKSLQPNARELDLSTIYNNKFQRNDSFKSLENNNHRGTPTDEKIRREPSESTLPEYAYDNPTLAPSPTHHV